MTTVAERYLIVSLGSIGRRHLRNLRQLRPNSEIAILHLRASSEHSRAADGANHVFESLDDAVDFAPKAAIVAGPASTHVSIAQKLAEAGVHLLVEKPLSNAVEGCSELIDTVQGRGLVLMTGYNLSFLPSLQVAKACLDRGMIGHVIAARAEVGQFLPDWRPGTDYRAGVSAQSRLGGGALLELSHELHYLYWMFGMPSRVTARGGQLGDLDMDVEDLVELTLEYESPRRLVNVHLDLVQRVPHRSCRFIGSEGTLVWDAMRDSVEAYQAESGTWAQVPVRSLSDRNQMYVDELQHFLDCIERGLRPVVDGTDGLKTLVIVDAAKRSMACNSTVEVVSPGE
jgi:predicted dehydrogenase